MNTYDRAWIEELRETKTHGNIGFGARQMRRLLGIVDALEAEADALALRLAESDAPCPEDSFCMGTVRPDCAGLPETELCQMCYRADAEAKAKEISHE